MYSLPFGRNGLCSQIRVVQLASVQHSENRSKFDNWHGFLLCSTFPSHKKAFCSNKDQGWDHWGYNGMFHHLIISVPKYSGFLFTIPDSFANSRVVVIALLSVMETIFKTSKIGTLALSWNWKQEIHCELVLLDFLQIQFWTEKLIGHAILLHLIGGSQKKQ